MASHSSCVAESFTGERGGPPSKVQETGMKFEGLWKGSPYVGRVSSLSIGVLVCSDMYSCFRVVCWFYHVLSENSNLW